MYARNELKQRKPFKNTCKMARFTYAHRVVNVSLKSHSYLYTCLLLHLLPYSADGADFELVVSNQFFSVVLVAYK